MMRRAFLVVGALVLGLVPFAWLLTARPDDDGAPSSDQTESCEELYVEDISTPWPGIPPVGEIGEPEDPVPNLYVSAIAEVAGVATDGAAENGYVADVTFGRVLYQTSFPRTPEDRAVYPLRSGSSYRVVAYDDWWGDLSAAIASGDRVLLGISGVRADGALSPGFATYQSRFFSGRLEREPHDSGMLASFLTLSGAAGEGGLESFLVVLNEETDAPLGAWPADGPTRNTWDRFVRDEVLVNPTTTPWIERSPECRTLLDAPPSVIAGLEPVRIVFDIPPQWLQGGDAVICLRVELGSMGCTAPDAGHGEPVIMNEAWIEPGRGVDVQVARVVEGDPSWTERVTIATIPADLFGDSHEVRVRLSTTTIPEDYDDVVLSQDEELVVDMTPA